MFALFCVFRFLHQVHPGGIRHIRADKRINEWKPPGKKKIRLAAANERQVLVALTGGELIYFELDRTGQLMDSDKRDMGSDVTSLALPPVPKGALRSKFAAVGLFDNTVRLLSLDPDEQLKQVTMQAAASVPNALILLPMSTSGSSENENLFLFVGLHNGVLTRSLVDPVEGKLTDTRKRFLGTRPIKLFSLFSSFLTFSNPYIS